MGVWHELDMCACMLALRLLPSILACLPTTTDQTAVSGTLASWPVVAGQTRGGREGGRASNDANIAVC